MATSTATKIINPSVTISEIPKILNICYKGSITPNLVGTQGIGKSEAVRDFKEEFKFDSVIDIRLGQMEIGDLIGLPKIEVIDKEYVTIWGRPAWWPRTGKHIVFLDEWNRAATTDVIQAVFQLILDRRLHTHILPPECMVVAAMNPADTGFMVNKIRDKALSDRMLHINVQPTSEGWLKWAAEKKLDSDVIDYIRINTDALGNSSFTMEKREPTPRAFAALSRIFKACTKEEWEAFSSILACGLIGPERAMQFIKFKADRNYKPFSAKDILKDYPKHVAKITEWSNYDNFRSDVVIATLDNLTQYFSEFKTLDDFKAQYKGAGKLKAAMDNYSAFIKLVPEDVARKHVADIIKLLSSCESAYILNLVDIMKNSIKITPAKKEPKDVGTK